MTLIPADINTPFYYLTNFHSALQHVLSHSADLLQASEQQALAEFAALPQSAQALLLRMVMRKGDYFRSEALNYSEIPEREQALQQLHAAALCEYDAAINAATLSQLLRKDELIGVLTAHTGLSAAVLRKEKKDALVSRLLTPEVAASEQTFSCWLNAGNKAPENPEKVIRLLCSPLFDTIRLLFFGNVWQDWSEFVLTELGHQRYETVALNAQSRAFQQRSELDYFIRLSNARQTLADTMVAVKDKRLDAQTAAGHCRQLADSLISDPPHQAQGERPAFAENHWLSLRWHKALAQTGREAERLNDPELALLCYGESQHREARVRSLRVRELQAQTADDFLALAHDCQRALNDITHPEARITLQRIYACSGQLFPDSLLSRFSACAGVNPPL